MVAPLVASGLAAVLLTVSWALAIAAITSRFWSIRGTYDTSDPPNLTGYASRSPFNECSRGVGHNSAWNCQRTKSPGGLCDPHNLDSPVLCQTLAVSCKLLIAACVLLGLAFLASVAHVFASATKFTQRSFLSLALFLLASSGAFCMAIAELAAVLGLLVLNFPNPEAGTSVSTPSDFLSTWKGHSGLSLATASWTLAAFAVVFIAWTPARARDQHDRHSHHHEHGSNKD